MPTPSKKKPGQKPGLWYRPTGLADRTRYTNESIKALYPQSGSTATTDKKKKNF